MADLSDHLVQNSGWYHFSGKQFTYNTTNDSKSKSFPFIQRYRRYLAILFKSIFCIHDKYLHFFLTFLKSSSLNKQEMVSQKERII